MRLALCTHPKRRRSVGAIVLAWATLPVAANAWGADSNPALDSAVGGLAPAQHIRVLTDDYRTLRGHFVRVETDSLLLEPPAVAGADRNLESVGMSDILFLWKREDYGVGRGLLWAGGTLLVGGVLAFGAADNIDSELSGMVFLGVTGAATMYAFYKGATGSKETLVYSRFRQ